MPDRHRRSLLLACTLLALTVPAGAQSRAKPAKSTRPPAPKVRYANGDSEAQRQRREEARLRRECKGRPNAGACLGHTR